MKQITVKVPDGKDAVWQKVENVGQVLMLIDETNIDETNDAKIDDRPVTERIKTFEDAYNALGEVNPLCKHYDNMRYLEDELPGKADDDEGQDRRDEDRGAVEGREAQARAGEERGQRNADRVLHQHMDDEEPGVIPKRVPE